MRNKKNAKVTGQRKHPNDPDDSSDEDSETTKDEKDQNSVYTNKDFEFIPELVNLPNTTYKSSNKYFSNKRKPTFEYPVSPLDANYTVGCNDDLFSSSTSSSKSFTSDQRKASQACKEWMRQHRGNSDLFEKVSKNKMSQ